MIYFGIAIVIVAFIEIKHKKILKKKTDIVFYITCTALSIAIVVFYYQDPFRLGIAEVILKYLDLGGIN